MPSTQSPQDLLAEQFAKNFNTVKDHLIARAGPPPASQRLSASKDDALYAYADPKVDKDALARQIMTTGLPPEMLDPNSPLALDIVKEVSKNPNYLPQFLQAVAQPTNDAEMADQLARMARNPYRWYPLKDITDPEEMVQKAHTLNRRFQEAHAATASPDVPAAVPPPADQQPDPVAPPAPAEPAPPSMPGALPPDATQPPPPDPMGGQS